MRGYKNVLDFIGNTPLVEISERSNPYLDDGVRIFAKLEGYNPSGSVKDRMAIKMIEIAEREGRLKKGMTILEATSGNTGIALSMIATLKGYDFVAVMSEGMSIERRKLIAAYGGEIVLTPEEKNTDGAIMKARELIEANPEKYFLTNQFGNCNNPLAYYETLANEILTGIGNIDCFVAGIGTGGTLMGTGQRLKEVLPSVKIYAVEPQSSHKIQGLKNMEESTVPRIYHEELLDGKILVKDDWAYYYTRELPKKEGIFGGISSGAAMYGALEIARHMAEKNESGNVVTVFADGGEKYLSVEGLF